MFPAGIYRQPDGANKIGLAWPGILAAELRNAGDQSPEAAEAYGRTALSNALFPSAVGRAVSPAVANSLGTFGGKLAKTADHRLRLYWPTSGEVEARTVQKRMDLNPEQRRARAPWLDYDVPENQQIGRLGGNGPQHWSNALMPGDG